MRANFGLSTRKIDHEGTKDTKVHKGIFMNHREIDFRTQKIATAVIDAGLKVHKLLGPGLLESAYEHCLAFELSQRGFSTRQQVALPVIYEGIKLDAGYRLDIIVNEAVILEIKSVEALAPIHEAQLLTYLKLSGLRIGLLLNFNVTLFKQGIKRFVV